MRQFHRSMAVVALGIVMLPVAAAAQNQPAPEVRYLTVTRFEVPPGEDRDKVAMWLDTVMVPLARMNPNVVSFHVANHNWGANSNEFVIIAEYPNWAAIEAECAACDKWSAETEPKEGTPEFTKWDDIGDTFAKYYGGHADEIYAIPVNRSKR
jgi:hypothetical protein